MRTTANEIPPSFSLAETEATLNLSIVSKSLLFDCIHGSNVHHYLWLCLEVGFAECLAMLDAKPAKATLHLPCCDFAFYRAHTNPPSQPQIQRHQPNAPRQTNHQIPDPTTPTRPPRRIND
jgi:hypothetical protein